MNTINDTHISAWSVDRSRMLTPTPATQPRWNEALDRAFVENIYAILQGIKETAGGTARLFRAHASDSPATYTIVTHQVPGQPVAVQCSCRAGATMTICKHAAAALEECGWGFDVESAPVVRTDLHDVVCTRDRFDRPTINIPHRADVDWGYLGSGPSNTAYAVLEWAVGTDFAAQYAHQFKTDVIARIPRTGGLIAADELVGWVQAVAA